MFFKFDFVKQLQRKYGCPVIHGGDLFDHWKPSPWLISKMMQNIPDEFYTVYGNHDLPQNSMELIEKCGIYTLHVAGKVHTLQSGNWGEKIKEPNLILQGRKILVIHKFIYKKKDYWKTRIDGAMAAGILRKYPQFDLIVSGDNHEAFVEEHEGRLLVNPGSLLRTTTKQKDFHPRVYLWYAETNTVKPVYIPIEEGVVSDKHIKKEEERDERMNAFISSLDYEDNVELHSSFEINLKTFLNSANNVSENVEKIIYKAIDKEAV